MNNIRKSRRERSMTQEELARELGIDRSTVAKWETGESNPRADMLPRIAGVLHCEISALFCE